MSAPSTENDPRNKCSTAAIVKMPARHSRGREVAAQRPSKDDGKKKGRSREQPFHCQAVARLREAICCLTRMSR
jgi:hypothetical protein